MPFMGVYIIAAPMKTPTDQEHGVRIRVEGQGAELPCKAAVQSLGACIRLLDAASGLVRLSGPSDKVRKGG